MVDYFDAHTHRDYAVGDGGVVGVCNYRWGVDSEIPKGLFSVGLHPYDVEKFNLNGIEKLLELPNCVAVGECGVDRRYGDLDLQIEVFEQQVALARQFNKPLIVHMVRSESEILKALKGFDGKILLHSYYKMTQNLQQLDNLFLSYSCRNIGYDKSPNFERLLLETDDSELDIRAVYRKFAEVYQIDMVWLKIKMKENFKQIFNR